MTRKQWRMAYIGGGLVALSLAAFLILTAGCPQCDRSSEEDAADASNPFEGEGAWSEASAALGRPRTVRSPLIGSWLPSP